MDHSSHQLRLVLTLGILALLQAGCSRTNRLGEFDFQNRSLAIAVTTPSRPDVFTGNWVHYDKDQPLRTLLQVGSSIVKEAEAEKARIRMDSAYQCVNLEAILTDRTHEQIARYLGAYPIDELLAADFILDIHIRKYGIDAKSWDASAHFTMVAEINLIDGQSGRLVWETKFEESEPLSPALWGPHPGLRNVLSAEALARLSIGEMTAALEQLADFTADRINSRLRRDLYKARG